MKQVINAYTDEHCVKRRSYYLLFDNSNVVLEHSGLWCRPAVVNMSLAVFILHEHALRF